MRKSYLRLIAMCGLMLAVFSVKTSAILKRSTSMPNIVTNSGNPIRKSVSSPSLFITSSKSKINLNIESVGDDLKTIGGIVNQSALSRRGRSNSFGSLSDISLALGAIGSDVNKQGSIKIKQEGPSSPKPTQHTKVSKDLSHEID